MKHRNLAGLVSLQFKLSVCVHCCCQFGGKLVTFENPPAASHSQQQAVPRVVNISQVVTETELVMRSDQLQQALNAGEYSEFCALKAANSTDAMQENIWNFLRVNFDNEPRSRFLQLLGYDQNDLARKVRGWFVCCVCL